MTMRPWSDIRRLWTANSARSHPEQDPTSSGSTANDAGTQRTPRRRTSRRIPADQRAQSGTTRRSRLRERLGWYDIADEPILTSTRQSEALNPALVATGQPPAGPPLGVDLQTGAPLCVDPHELYTCEPRRLSSPNVAILGDIGVGKSTIAKTQYVLRPLALGRQVCVFDRKRQSGRGEYSNVAEIAGGTVIRFDRAGGTIVNLLDPRISTTEQAQTEAGGGLIGQDRLLLMVAEFAHGELSSRERAALRAAHHTALALAQIQNRVATIRDVIDALYAPTEESLPRAGLAESGRLTPEDMFRWGLDLGLDLDRFVQGDLSGLIDGPTQDADGGELDLNRRLLVVDTSALDEDSPALSLVMAVMSSYLTAVWSQTPGQRVLVVEEGYHAARLAGVAEIFRSLAKRGRGIGLSLVSAFHHISDIPSTSAAMSLLRECGMAHIFRQSRADDADDAVRLFQLPDHVREELAYLGVGHHILRVERETPRYAAALRTAMEARLTATDAAMHAAAGGTP